LIGLALRKAFGQVAAMIRGFFRLVTQLIALVIVVFGLTAVYIVYDGLNDKGDTADCAVVLGHAVKADGQPGPVLQERLDRAVKLYKDKKVPLIMVSGGKPLEGPDEATAMAKYLKDHNVPEKDIVVDHDGINTAGTAQGVAAIMHKRKLHSVIVVSHYYHITRTKMALGHEGIHTVSQAHVGTFVREDAFNVAREVVALYYYIFQFEVKPAATQATIQAVDEAQKLKTQLQSGADKTKDSADKDAGDKDGAAKETK
jgi:vancomycin permeability regulator SanA